jgi:hypothetical protein
VDGGFARAPALQIRLASALQSSARENEVTSPTQANPRAQAFKEALREHVCGVCLDQRDDGSCGLTRRVCAIDRHLEHLVEVLSQVQSGRMDEYEAAVRAQICSGCPEQGADGRCALREEADCALYAYLPLVLEAIENVIAAETAE